MNRAIKIASGIFIRKKQLLFLKADMIHASTLEKYPGSLAELANDLGDLRYDALAEFLAHLSQKLTEDGNQDQERGRPQLAHRLIHSGNLLQASSKEIQKAWIICAPYMKTK